MSASEPVGLHAVHPDAGPGLAQRDGHAADQAAAADGDDEHVDVRQVLEQLEAARPVAQEDLRVVVRVDEDEAAFLAELAARCSSDSPTCSPWRTTSAPYSRHASTFDLDRRERHHDRHRHAGLATRPTRRPGPALPAEIVIAPRRRSSGVSDEIRARAARALNEPVFWRCSALR